MGISAVGQGQAATQGATAAPKHPAGHSVDLKSKHNNTFWKWH